MSFRIGNRTISDDSPMYIIAEAGVNHNGSLDWAIKLVDLAQEAGADAIKFQMYQTDHLVTHHGELAKYQRKSSFNTQYDMLKQYELSADQFAKLKTYCDQKNITFLATPFDHKSAHMLSEMNVDAFKIGSGDLTNYPLVDLVASYRKPVILSTGMATLKEITSVVKRLTPKTELVLLHCTSAYPAPYEDLHLNVIQTFRSTFDHAIGYSDHSLGCQVPYAVTSLGYNLLEKHVTLDRSLEGPDHQASMNPADFKQMVQGIRQIEQAMGAPEKTITPSEKEMRQFVRRGIYIDRNLPLGHPLTAEDLAYFRPVSEIEACHYETVIGSRLKRPKNKGEALTWDDLEFIDPTKGDNH